MDLAFGALSALSETEANPGAKPFAAVHAGAWDTGRQDSVPIEKQRAAECMAQRK